MIDSEASQRHHMYNYFIYTKQCPMNKVAELCSFLIMFFDPA